jgi:hypothetical protein
MLLLLLSLSIWYKYLPSRHVLTVKLIKKYSFIMEDSLLLYNYNCSLCWTNSMQFATLCQMSLELFLIFSSHMCFDLPYTYLHFSFCIHLLFASFCENFSLLWIVIVCFIHLWIYSFSYSTWSCDWHKFFIPYHNEKGCQHHNLHKEVHYQELLQPAFKLTSLLHTIFDFHIL